MVSNTRVVESDSPVEASDMWQPVSKAKEFKSETSNAQRPTSNAEFRAQKLNVKRWALSVER